MHRTVVSKRQGKPSITDFRVLASCPPYTWIEARPVTGRTHQIRAHLWTNQLSIVCDPLYGGNQKPVRCLKSSVPGGEIPLRSGPCWNDWDSMPTN